MSTIDAEKLQVAVEEGERWRRRMSITVPATVVTEQRAELVRELAGRMKVKGFRKGQVPTSVVEKRYGSALQRETLDKVISVAYRQALDREGVRPISEGEVEDVRFEPEEDLTFSISFDVSPEIVLGRLGGFKAERPRVQVEDANVDRVVDRLREQQGAWKPMDEGRVEEGDLVSVQLERLDEDDSSEPQSYDLILGQGDAIPDVESAILTLGVGESAEFDVTFPEDFADESRRGSSQRLRIALDSRRIRELPEADDEFARSIGEFEDLEALRSRISEDLQKDAEREAESAVRGQLLDYVIEANPFEVPITMVGAYVDSLIGDVEGVDEERVAEARDAIRPEAERAVKRILAIDRVAETQDLRATEEELDERIEEIAERNDSNPAKVYADLQKAGRLESLEREITETKVFDFLKSQSEVTEAP